MRKRGQPSKYFTHVEPHLEKIKEMATLMTEKEIAKSLKVAYSTFFTYKQKYPELNEALKKGKQDLVIDLKNTLIKKAKGFSYEEKNTIVEHGEVTREEIKSRVALPDVAAINLLLKNLDRDFWRNDPAEYELKKRMVEVQEKKAEEEEWEDVQGIS